MSEITTHVLDTSVGRPAAGVPVTLDAREGASSWKQLGRGVTDADGRLRDLSPQPLPAGAYRLTFDTRAYFESRQTTTFYPEVAIVFELRDAAAKYHVPLLISPYGYSTYRGS
ncbi:MAG TPA: hydroxyisourate hydrolase [Candidatus Acidoferrales bacterium]|jgi:5-hydroxyisourate hydrolase|nr:hydroxyisourate hydrolase [Candidatus Acidoferrales bacterium]